jgi:hypothetical protein
VAEKRDKKIPNSAQIKVFIIPMNVQIKIDLIIVCISIVICYLWLIEMVRELQIKLITSER